MAKLDQYGGTYSTVNAGFVAGTTSTYTTTASTAGCIRGKWATALTAQTNTASPTTDANTAAAFIALQPNQTCALVMGVNAAGAIKYVQGPIISTYTGVTTTVGAFRDAPQFPNLPDDFLPCAYTLIRTAPSAAAFTIGTSNWTASGVSCTTFANVGVLPDRPQIA